MLHLLLNNLSAPLKGGNHLKFEKGFLIIEKDWYPNIDNKKLEKYTIFKEKIKFHTTTRIK